MNSIIEIAKKDGRDYVTPKDVSEALKQSRFSSQKVRLEILEILAKQPIMEQRIQASVHLLHGEVNPDNDRTQPHF